MAPNKMVTFQEREYHNSNRLLTKTILEEGRKESYQQTIGTKTYFFEKICFFLIQVSTLSLVVGFIYKENHKQSRYVKEVFLSSEKLFHKDLHISSKFLIPCSKSKPTFSQQITQMLHSLKVALKGSRV